MLKRIGFLSVLFGTLSMAVRAQDNVYPAPATKGVTAIINGTVHVGNGTVHQNGTVLFENGKISYAGTGATVPAGAKTIDAAGAHVYPGLILPNSRMGIMEVGAGTRATNDFAELGDMNPNVRSIVAYNAESKIINTVRSNGVLLAQVVPAGGLISGTSSIVQLDAWNWEDAAYHMDGGIHINLPSLLNRPNPFAAFTGAQQSGDRLQNALDRIETLKAYFRSAELYNKQARPEKIDLKAESIKGLFDKSKKLYVHCNLVKEMLIAVDFVKDFGFDVVIVGGSESYQIPDLLKKHNIPVILAQMHSLPTMIDDDIDQPFKTPAILQKAGVLFSIGDEDSHNRGRNISFNAGTAASYGLSKEEALSAITLNTAKILGIADRTGSLEAGKDANIVISKGDILDMRSSVITHAFIQGRAISLDDKHKQLNERYNSKYGL